MTWAKVIEGEVVQTFHEDPAKHWHPDALVHWEDVPEGVTIGWKKKDDGTFVSAEDWQAENPQTIPDPGPPGVVIRTGVTTDDVNPNVDLELSCEIIGDWDEEDPTHIPTWDVDDGAHTSNEFEWTVSIPKNTSAREITVTCSAVGTGGTSEVFTETVFIPASV